MCGGANAKSDAALNVLFALNIIDGTMAVALVVYGLVALFKENLQAFWYLWMPMFAIGGLLFLTVFLSVFGVWAKQNGCGCFLGLSSCLGILTMLLETTVAIVTLTAKDKVVDAFCTKVVKGTVKPPACDKAHPDGVAAYTYDDIDAAGSDGSNNPNPDDDPTSKVVQKAIADYEAYSEPIAYALFALAFLQLCRFLMGRYVDKERSDLDQPLYDSRSSKERVNDMRSRNRYVRQQEQAMMEGRPMAATAGEDSINISEGGSSCVIS